MDTPDLVKLTGLLFLLFLSQFSWAATTSTSFTVSATVVNNCTTSATALSFGNYDPTSGSDTSGTNTVTVTCTNGDAYTIALNGGTTSGGSISQRKMTDGASHYLNYNIFQNAGHTTLWGDGTTGNTLSGTGTAVAQNYTGYGSITASQTVPSGSYTDTITVTITF
jgi:spore coat protein U-like protein